MALTFECKFLVDSGAPYIAEYIKEASSERLSHPEAEGSRPSLDLSGSRSPSPKAKGSNRPGKDEMG